VIAGDLFSAPDYTYGVVAANFMEGAYSNELPIFEQSMENLLRYLELGGFFAVTVLLEPENFIAPDGIRIPMPKKITESFLSRVFDELPVKYKMYIIGENDIRPDKHRGMALIAGRKIKEA
jgi:hypothetical protein